MSGLDRLFASKHRHDRLDAARLDAGEVQRTTAIARGEEASRYRLRAIELVASLDTRDAARTLAGLVTSSAQPIDVRVAAARLLGRRPGSEKPLLDALRTGGPPLLRARLAGALARVGTAQAVTALRPELDAKEAFVRKMASFAIAVIGHREGDSALRLPPLESAAILEGDRLMRPVAVSSAAAGDIAETVASLAGDTFGIDPDRRQALALKCGPNVFRVLLNAGPLEKGLARIAPERPVLVGVVAGRAAVDGSYSASHVLLAGPLEGGAAYIAAYRMDGTLMHWGSGKPYGDGADFVLQSVHVRGNFALDVRGRVAGSEIAITRAVTGVRSTGSSAPRPFTLPA